jgi:hypothetical protein
MSTTVNTPFRSKFGFESTGFTVDEEGNISAKSINLVEEEPVDPVVPDTDIPADRKFTEVGGNFRLENNVNDNPGFTVFRTKSTTIDLELTTLTFNIYSDEDLTILYNTGLLHSDGDSGVSAQGKSDGRLAWNVALTTPRTLYYANSDGSVFGIITVENAPSAFSEVSITGTTPSIDTTSGALVVSGGAGIGGDLNIGGELNIQGVGIPVLSSNTNLDLEAGNSIVIRIDDVLLGKIESAGSSVPVVNTSINNTTIGATTPTIAAFTSATVSNDPTVNSEIANKQYVDRTAVALAVAFGL